MLFVKQNTTQHPNRKYHKGHRKVFFQYLKDKAEVKAMKQQDLHARQRHRHVVDVLSMFLLLMPD